MAEVYTCQRCGAAVADSAQGLCPACLFQEGLRDSQASTIPSNSAASTVAELAELARLFPQLEVLEFVGRGGMGVVYKARQRGLDRLVALKVLPPEVDRDPGFRERFVREARALARLTHPNIVAVYDFGQVEGRYYFLMEFVDGANLRRMLQSGHLTPQQAMSIVPQLCDALQFAHEEGIVHRDIKPENILVDRKGRVKIADFGLAKLLSGTVPQDPYTLTGPRQVLGTPHYMAPEQFERPATVDHRADIYSMGVVFYEMLTGELPLGRFPPPSRKVQVDVRLDEVVLRTLEKEPQQRYQRAGQVKTELASLATLPSDGGPPTWSARAAGPPPNPVQSAASARVSPFAIWGLVCLIAPVPLAILWSLAIFGLSDRGPMMAPPVIAAFAAAMLDLAAIVGSCVLGIAAINQIRRSQGRYCGLKLALVDALAYPLLLLDAIFVWAGMSLIDPGPAGGDKFGLLLCLMALGLDWLILWRIWRRLAMPPMGHPAAPPSAPAPPPRPAYPPSHYALPPRRRLGCLIASCVTAGVLFLLLLGIIVPITASRRVMSQSAIMPASPVYITVDPSSDGPGSPLVPHTYRFRIQSPPDMKATIWAEIWHNGQIEPTPGFPVTQWMIPPRFAGLIGTVTLRLGAPERGQIKAEWDITGTAGSTHVEHMIPNPFEKMIPTNTEMPSPGGPGITMSGNRIQLLAIRGSRHGFEGGLSDESLIGRADGEIRVFARFDRMTVAEARRGAMIGESEQLPSRVFRYPMTAPAAPAAPGQAPTQELTPDGQPPAIRGTAAEGLVR